MRNSPGVLAVAEGARRAGFARLIVPRERAGEASLVEGIAVVGVERLREAAEIVMGADPRPVPSSPGNVSPVARPEPDLVDVRGQAAAVFALQVAAAGGHNLLFEGAPGTGKTMLARRVPSILPGMTQAEALEVTRIHSIAGSHSGGLIAARPFRAPHHTISPAGLVGGGTPPRPGEVSLATPRVSKRRLETKPGRLLPCGAWSRRRRSTQLRSSFVI